MESQLAVWETPEFDEIAVAPEVTMYVNPTNDITAVMAAKITVESTGENPSNPKLVPASRAPRVGVGSERRTVLGRPSPGGAWGWFCGVRRPRGAGRGVRCPWMTVRGGAV